MPTGGTCRPSRLPRLPSVGTDGCAEASPWARLLPTGSSSRPPLRRVSPAAVQALGNALRELAAVGLRCRQRALAPPFSPLPRLEGVVASATAASMDSPSITQPGRSGAVTRKPPPPRGEAARFGWRSAKTRRLWRHNQPSTLRHLVADELRTFGGLQGTDLACGPAVAGAVAGWSCRAWPS